MEDDASTLWHAVEPGGDLEVSQWLFLDQSATDASRYNYLYQNWFGDVSYTVYLAEEVLDAGGNLDVSAATWSMSMTLQGDGYAQTDGTGQVPAGKLVIVPDLTAVQAKDEAQPVDSDNQVTEQVWAEVDVNVGETATAAFYLRYKEGGFLELHKQFLDVDGNPGSVSGKQATFTFASEDGKTVYENVATDADGKISMAMKAGTYTVTETSGPDGYLSAGPWTIVVPAGGWAHLADEDDASVVILDNTVNQGRLTIGSKLGVIWNTEDADATKADFSDYTDDQCTYEIYQNGSQYTLDGESVFQAGSYVLPLLDENGIPYSYTVKAIQANDDAYGSMDENNAMTDGTESAAFTLDDDDRNVHVDFYYRKCGTVYAYKTINDSVGAGLTLSGWTMVLSGGALAETRSQVTDGDGMVMFDDVPLYDTANHCFYTYTVTEDNTAAQESYSCTVEYSPTDGTATFADGDSYTTQAQVNVTNTVNAYRLTVTKRDADTDALLGGASFVVTMQQDGKTLYLKADGSFSENKADGLVLTTDEDGTATVLVPCEAGVTLNLTAHETTAPDGYNVGEDQAFSPACGPNVSAATAATDVKKPTLTVTKKLQQFENGQLVDVTDELEGETTFGVYYDEACTKPVMLNGNAVTVTLKKANVPATITLDQVTDYYLREESSPEGWISPAVWSASGSNVVKASVTESTTKAVSYEAEITNIVNTGSVRVSKYDKRYQTLVDYTSATFALLVAAPDDDTATQL